MTDPNWLCLSVAQSTAAIVAIVGGFITSTLLLRTAERDTLAARLEERRREVEALQAERDSVRPRADRRRAEFATNARFAEVVSSAAAKEPALPSATEARVRFEAEDVPEAAFAAVWRGTPTRLPRNGESSPCRRPPCRRTPGACCAVR